VNNLQYRENRNETPVSKNLTPKACSSVVEQRPFNLNPRKSTAEILEESRKARQAAEQQAAAVQQSISASVSQATAAQASVDLLRQ
jgi:hypothetical protein